MRRRAAGALAFLAALFLGGRARANMAESRAEGSGSGVMVARRSSPLRVDAEDLVFDVAPNLGSARVVATYRFTNPTDAQRVGEVAFVYVRGPHAFSPDVPDVSIKVDGAPIAWKRITDTDQLTPQLEAWVAAHPGAVANSPTLSAWLDATGGMRDELVVLAAREVIPQAVAAMEVGWTQLGAPRRMTWLVFELKVAAGASQIVEVAYTHVPGFDHETRVNTTYEYEYLLSPAKTWASFGALRLRVTLPPKTWARSSIAWRRDGDDYLATLDGLPDGELVFSVMSTDRMWFGMTTPPGYWAILLATLTGVASAAGVALRRPERKGRAIRAVAGTAVGLLAGGGVCVLVSYVFPPHALGFGYGPAFGELLLVPVFAALAGAVAACAGYGRRRE
jgi:hypothetical protein